MPPWHLEGGHDLLTEKLKSKEYRAQVKAEKENPETPYDNFLLNSGGWDGVYITSAANTPDAEGKYISEYAKLVGKDPWNAYFDMCVESNCKASGCIFKHV